MKTLALKYMAVIALACAAFVGIAPKASAMLQIVTPLTIGDIHELGFVNYGIPSGDADRTTYVNHLVGMVLGGHDFGDGQEYFRSTNNFGTLPTAVFDHNSSGNPSTTIDLGTTAGVYTYLFAKYDGPNYGSEVWYVGNLTGIITIPEFAGGQGAGGSGYQLSGWTLFTGVGPGGHGVPEGGSTIAFLGLALTAAELLRRGVSRRAAVKI
jgi:hypothetical protein